MAGMSAIEWTDATWNPTVGCTIVSPGCTHCYAMKQAARIIAMAGTSKTALHYDKTVKDLKGTPVWTGHVNLSPDHILTAPLRWKKPRRVFVNSMSDLFHDSIPDEWIDRVFAVMALCPQHTFQVLTKRAERMREYMNAAHPRVITQTESGLDNVSIATPKAYYSRTVIGDKIAWPLPNVWLGISAERQKEADERIPHLLNTPAAVRFVSAEPLLGPIDFHAIIAQSRLSEFPNGEPALANLDWIIVGGESGPHARPMHPQWARDIRDQCRATGVPFFFKQWGEWTPGENVERQRGTVETAVWFNNRWLMSSENLANHEGHIDDEPDLYRVGKKAAGRLLDGVEHNGFPEVRT